jgi:hypothetical protein
MTTTLALLGTSSAVEVDVSNDNALFAELRSPAVGSLGVYGEAAQSGAITATMASGATVFSMRWTDSTRLCLIRRVSVVGIVLTTITTAVRSDLQLFVARSFTSSDSAGTAVVPSSSENKLRTSFGGTLFATGNIRVASTAAVTAGTRTLDTNPIGRVLGFYATAAGSYVFGQGGGYAYLWDRTQLGLHPLVLAQNEGIVVTSSAAGPATGTFTLGFQVEWLETAAY